jgi:serine kinase of HPr protein (carbohydrate metabolism regulator)
VHAIGRVEGGEYRICFPGLATFAFRPGESEARVGPEPDAPRRVVEDLFLTTAMPLLLQSEGFEALHASAVQTGGGVVACCGFSGSGKTTVAYGLARRGHPVWADDTVLLVPGDAQTAWSSLRLPHAFNLRPGAKRFFGIRHDSEALVETATADKDRLAAVVALRRESRSTVEVGRLPLGASVTALMPHAYCFFAEEGREGRTAAAYLDLAARVPVFQARLPDDFTEFDRVVDELVTRLSEAVGDA